MGSKNHFENFSQLVYSRRTHKVSLPSGKKVPIKPFPREDLNKMLEMASRAPFHFPANAIYLSESTGLCPWRFYILESKACQQMAVQLAELGLANHAKYCGMLNAASLLVFVSCLVEPKDLPEEEQQKKNQEHFASTGVAIHNFILSAEALNWRSYWSSAKVFKQQEIRSSLQVPEGEHLFSCIYLFEEDLGGSTSKGGAFRDKISDLETWVKF